MWLLVLSLLTMRQLQVSYYLQVQFKQISKSYKSGLAPVAFQVYTQQ